jgi:hypothetical protein
MSSSRHPIALRLEQQVGGATKLLATVMLLPLVDGIFPALVLADALNSTVGILQVGLLVFGGSATLAVVLVEMEEDPLEQTKSILLVGIPLIVIAAVEAAVAPTIASVIDIVIFERFAAIVIVAVAAKTASATIGEYLPRPSIIIGLGAIASIDPTSVSITVSTNPELIARAVAAAGVGVGFALSVVALRPRIQGMVDIDRFRFGSAVALGTLALSIIHVVPSEAPLPVFAVAGLLAFDPSGEDADEPAASAPTPTTDGGSTLDEEDVPSSEDTKQHYGYPGERSRDERAPWL